MSTATESQRAHETESSPAPVLLRVDDRRVDQPTPIGTALVVATSSSPRLSWVVPLVRTGQAQTAYEIRASGGDDDVTVGRVWASGLVESAENSDVRWGGGPLAAHDRVRFVVRTRDERGVLSDWSDAAAIQTGPFTRADWRARWIAVPAAHAASIDFDVPPGAPLFRATLHLAGHGVVRAAIDGRAVNPDARDLTDASLTRSTSRSYDVTEFVSNGTSAHRLSLIASIGHYRKVLTRPRVLAELRIVRRDGTEIIVGTDASWTHRATSLVNDEPFYVEEHDARVTDEWTAIGVSGEAVDVLEEVEPGAVPAPHQAPGVVVPDQGPPVRIVRRQPATLLGVVDGVYVFDLGENVAGRSRVELESTTPGATITVAQGEKLDAVGRVDTTNIRMPDDVERERQLVVWHADGSALTVEPWFAVGGFRYIEVRGHTGETAPVVSAGVLHSDAARTGWLQTDVPQLDAVVDAALRTQLNNTNGFPSDCPTREQAGWTGDASVSVEAALAHLDLAGMYRNWLTDVALDAQPGGGIRGVAPNLLGYEEEQGADPVWGSALNEILWQLWWTTGDTSTITPLLPALRNWVDWQVGTLEDGVSRNADLSFGADWLALEQTPPVMLQTGAVVQSLRQLADLEEATGDADAAAHRRAQADDVVAAARRLLRDPVEATWANESQGSTAVALATRLAPAEDVAGLQERLRAAVSALGDRLATGFSATRSAVSALADADGGTALLDAIRQEEQPGIGSMLVDGPGTFWEAWWIDDENVGVASLDHIGLGAPFAAWTWTHAAGIRPLSPGYRRFSLAPRLLGEVNRADIRRDTPRGRIEAAWSYDGDTFSADLSVPVGSTAVVTLPGQADAELEAGHHRLEVSGVAPARRTPPVAPPLVRPERGARWLSDGATSTWLPAGNSVTVELVDRDSFCAPVHHESVGAPYLQVTVDPFPPDVEAWITLEQDGPLDLTDASFVSAHVDVDNGGFVGRALRPLIRVTSADGETRVGEARPFPVQWTRVAVDIGDWPGRTAVAKVQVGLRWSDVHDSRRGPYLPLPAGPMPYPFKVGRVGWTNATRTY